MEARSCNRKGGSGHRDLESMKSLQDVVQANLQVHRVSTSAAANAVEGDRMVVVERGMQLPGWCSRRTCQLPNTPTRT